MSKCDNPDCTRDHELEDQIADVCEQAARKVSVLLGGGPHDAIYGLAIALVRTSFFMSLSGREKEAAADLVELVQQFTDMVLKDEGAMRLKRKKDEEYAADHTSKKVRLN